MVGTVNSQAGPIAVRIIDQNGNGKFNDVGSDAMIVGNTDHAMMLSATIYVDDKLQNIAKSLCSLSFVVYQSGPNDLARLAYVREYTDEGMSIVVLSHPLATPPRPARRGGPRTSSGAGSSAPAGRRWSSRRQRCTQGLAQHVSPAAGACTRGGR